MDAIFDFSFYAIFFLGLFTILKLIYKELFLDIYRRFKKSKELSGSSGSSGLRTK